MADLQDVEWPPDPIRTERLSLREREPRDRGAVIDLFASPEVGKYLGGARPRGELEQAIPKVPRRRPGFFVVECDGDLIGTVTLDLREAEAPPDVPLSGGEVELGYLFLPEAWGQGYAAEACAAALHWLATALPGQLVVLCTQIANERSMRLAARLRFIEVARFEQHGAEQWLGARPAASPC